MSRSIVGECVRCRYRESIPGDAHIKCTKPDKEMVGARHGRLLGWFNYPSNFDPVWKARLCRNFETVDRPGVDNVY